MPILRPVMGVALAVGFIFCFGELSVTLFCSPPEIATVPVRLFTVMANSPTDIVAAVTLTLISVCIPFAALAFLLSKQRSAKKI